MSLPASAKAVIFDMDGVLWLSSSVHALAFQQVLKGEGIDDFEYSRYAGMRTVECLKLVFEQRRRAVTDAKIAELAVEKNRIAVETLRRDPPVIACCAAVLEQLSATYPLALATSASTNTMDTFLETSGCRPFFSVLLSGKCVAHPKPAPDIYAEAARQLGVDPKHAVVVEDAIAGVQAGKSAGSVVWALPTTCSAEELTAAGADRIIESLECLV